MALLPQNPRSQKLLVVGLLAVGVAVAYQQLVWTPKNAELALIQVRLDTLDSLNRMAKFEVAKGTASKMKEEADVYARELSVLRHLVPLENEVPALLEAVSQAARRANLELSDVQPDGVVNGDQFNTYRYKMAVSGPYHEVAQFLSNVGSLARIVEPINVTLALANHTTERRMKKDEQLLDAHFQIQTYVARTTTDTPPTSGTAGAP